MNQNLLESYGLTEDIKSVFSKRENYHLARIIHQEKQLYTIVSSSGFHQATLSGKMMYEAVSFLDYPAVGDYVEIEIQNPNSIIHRILPRYSMLERKSAGVTSGGQLIASNLDKVFICMSLNENYNLRRLERYLAVVFASLAEPVVLLTKSDLATNLEEIIDEVRQCAPNVTILTSTSENDDVYQSVKNCLLPNKTYAFIGSSGVGKSTLVNALLETQSIETYEVGKMARGRHTTTSRSLYLSTEGYLIIDTPGMREMQLDTVDFESSFQNIETLALSCRFSNCTHMKEPACAVKRAINDGEIPLERLLNYQKLKKEAAYQGMKLARSVQQKTKKRY